MVATTILSTHSNYFIELLLGYINQWYCFAFVTCFILFFSFLWSFFSPWNYYYYYYCFVSFRFVSFSVLIVLQMFLFTCDKIPIYAWHINFTSPYELFSLSTHSLTRLPYIYEYTRASYSKLIGCKMYILMLKYLLSYWHFINNKERMCMLIIIIVISTFNFSSHVF